MKKALLKVAVMLLCLAGVTPAMAQFNLKKAVGGAVKAAKAVTLTDEQMTEYVKEYIDWMDKHNQVCADDDPYTVRLKKLTEGLTEVEGMPLNFKVYYVIDVNAFACADGSVRVFSSLMDIMTDEELLGVIGHEVGHVAHKDSKNGFRTALLTSAICFSKDDISKRTADTLAFSLSTTVTLPFPCDDTEEVFSTPTTEATNPSTLEVISCSMTRCDAPGQLNEIVSLFPCSGDGW